METTKIADEPAQIAQSPLQDASQPEATGESDPPCPFPPDEITNAKDIRNLYGLFWLSKS